MNGQAERLIELKNLEFGARPVGNPKIVSVISGKGGTGKSFFALNFAFHLAKQGMRVLLLDFDLSLPNLHIMLNKTVRKPLSLALANEESLGELIYTYNNRLDIVFGDSDKENEKEIAVSNLETLFRQIESIKENYDFIILDNAAGIDDTIIYQSLIVGSVIVLTTPEPTAIMDSYVTIKLLQQQKEETSIKVVINKCLSHEEGEYSFNNLNRASIHFLQKELGLLGSISFHNDVYLSVVSQQLLSEAKPDSLASLEISRIASKFVNNAQLAKNSQPFQRSL